MRATDPFFIRLALLTPIATSVVLMAVKVASYRSLLKMPGGLGYVLETAGLLLLYAAAVWWATRNEGSRAILQLATPMGLLGAAIQIVHLAQEHFFDLGKLGNGIAALGLLFCTFVLWGISGYRAARINPGLRSSGWAGLWSAVVTMTVLIIFGFVLEFYLSPPAPEAVASWGEFQRSGWTDLRAFAIVNTLDSAQSHLIAGPILGAVCGAIGGIILRLRGKQIPGAALRDE